MSDCSTRECCGTGGVPGPISLPGTDDHDTPWKFYNHLIAQIPPEVLVRDCCVGTHWAYLEADCGLGVSFTLGGGGKPVHNGLVSGLPLANVAQLAKSWNWREATIGIAALNAWYSQAEKVGALGGLIDTQTAANAQGKHASDSPVDPFNRLQPQWQGKKVCVVGHFPGVEEMAQQCQLTVLERNCRDSLDTPDPACEYILPAQDYVFCTGTTLINKTAPRLFELARDATLVLVGPSAVPSPFLFKWGVDAICGRVAVDIATAKDAVKQGAGFNGSLRMFYLPCS
jgi:uncharacterized protein (DUF4213/DUF364 family)